MIFNSPVYPITPSFTKTEELDTKSVANYLGYLNENGVTNVMTTAGTSQFNLLNNIEVRILNDSLKNFNGNKIIGIPSLSFHNIKKEIEYYNESFKGVSNTYLLILFPERYYTDDQIFNFYNNISKISDFPILSHANTMRKGNGGNYIYKKSLLTKLSEIPKFIGIKEESPTIDFSIKELKNVNLEMIVAGGSMRRFWCLEPFCATSYLSGVGSFFPKIEESFYKSYIDGDIKMSKKIMVDVEYPLFETFMGIGWHASMRYALQTMGFIQNNRSPFIELGINEKEKIKNVLNKIKKYEDIYNWSM